MPQLDEVWLDIPYSDSLYSVSSFGRVRRNLGGRNTYAGKILNAWAKSDGYRFVTVTMHGCRKSVSVHSLVAHSFLGPCPSQKEINHKDFDKNNNHYENLEYVTRLENVQHAARAGRYHVPKKRRVANGSSVR